MPAVALLTRLIRGRDGRLLADEWRYGGAQAYRGTAVADSQPVPAHRSEQCAVAQLGGEGSDPGSLCARRTARDDVPRAGGRGGATASPGCFCARSTGPDVGDGVVTGGAEAD